MRTPSDPGHPRHAGAHGLVPFAVGLVYLAGAVLGLAATRDTNGVAALWPCNAILIGVLLLRPRAPVRIVAWCACASFAGNIWFGTAPVPSAFNTLGNVAEVLAGMAIARRVRLDPSGMDRPWEVARFSLMALFAASTGATLAALPLYRTPAPAVSVWTAWLLSDLLGMLIITPPLLMAVWSRRTSAALMTASPARSVGLLASVLVVALGVFCQSTFPLLFLPVAPLMAVTYSLGPVGTGFGILLVAAVGTVCTLSGIGPVALATGSMAVHIHFLQFYLATIFAVCLPMAAALSQRTRLATAVRASEARHRRIVERSPSVIFETDAHGRWTFLNQAWTQLTGHAVAASLGTRTLALLPVEQRRVLLAALRALRGNGEEMVREISFTGADGTLRWAKVTLSALTDEAGQPIGVTGTLDDITAARAARLAIVESERRYRLLADNAIDLIVRVAIDGTLLYASPACERLLGMKPEALIGRSLFEGIAAEDHALFRAAGEALVAGAEDQTCTYRQSHADGRILWLEAAIRLSRDAEGRPVEYHAAVRDVTRRANAEAETAVALAQLQESHRLLSLAGSVSRVGHFSLDVASGTLVWSEEVCRMHGVECAPPLADALAFYHLDDRPTVHEVVGRAIAEGKDYDFRARLVRGDGSIRHIISSGLAVRGADGSTVGLFGVIQDVTDRAEADAELRASEERFRAITEQAGDMISLHAIDGTYLFASAAAQAVLRYDPAELIGRQALDWLLPEDRDALVARGIIPSPSAPTTRVRMRRGDGAVAWLEVRARLTEIGGEPRIVAVSRDVSEQVEAEAELRAARAEAEAALRAKAEFLANMSHEIRTPMNGVIGFTELLLASPLGDEQRRHAQLIAESGKAMMTLLNDILDVSKIDAGQLDVAHEPFPLGDTLRSCAALLTPAAERKGLSVDLALADDLPPAVRGDALRLRQVVLNLIGNAIKFTTAGGVTLSAKTADGRLVIAVADTGIGIPAERQAAVFEPFVQADHSITRRYGGSGLGLSISHRLATLMGGTLSLVSAPGEGTTITLDLPLTIAERAPQPPRAVAAPAPRTPPARAAHVLLAEDHDINQLLVTSMLARAGHKVTVAANGAVALAMVEASYAEGAPFDLVLMDMQMPVMDGLTATRAIRALGGAAATLPIVALTANAFAADLEACHDAGMDDHLAKPVSTDMLLAAIAHWMPGAHPAPAPHVPSASLTRRYADQKAATLAALDALLRQGALTDASLDDVAVRLHKLAGTAAMFGEAAVGERARELERGLKRWAGDDRVTAIRAAAEAIRGAA